MPTRSSPQRGTNPNDTVTLARQQRMGVRTQADVSAELARMQSLSAAGDVPDTFPVPVVFNNDLTMRGGRYYIILDDATQILRIGPTFDPSDPLATVNGNSFVFSWDGTHVTLAGEGSSGSFTGWTLTDEGNFTARNAGITLKDAANVTTMVLGGNTGAKITLDSSTAFLVEQADGDDIFAISTTGLNVHVLGSNLVVWSDFAGTVEQYRIRSNGHTLSSGTSPTIAAGAAAGSSPTLAITGTDKSGRIDITTGTSTTTGTLATITFANAWGSINYRGLLYPAEADAASTGAIRTFLSSSSRTTTTITIDVTGSALTASTAYSWFFAFEEYLP